MRLALPPYLAPAVSEQRISLSVYVRRERRKQGFDVHLARRCLLDFLSAPDLFPAER